MTSSNFELSNFELSSFGLSNFGFGKIIFFGEHFVVHGLPAVAAALDLKTYTYLQENCLQENDFKKNYLQKNSCDKLVLIDNRPKAPGFVPNKSTQYKLVCENILNFFKIKQRNFTVTFSGNLPVTCGGIGSSAAFAVSFARAVNSKFNLGSSNELINQAAYFGEQAVHGTPSGIDNSVATFGGVIKFCKQESVSEFTPAFLYSKVRIIKPIEIVIIDSGKQTDTKRAIESVRDFIQKNRAQADKIFEQYKDIFNLGINALENNNLKKLGMCMNENHRLLQELGVSCPELDQIVNKALILGALGAKLTGTGLGGLVVALTPGRVLQDLVAKQFEREGYFVIKTTIQQSDTLN
jgi:mevalonate kinase